MKNIIENIKQDVEELFSNDASGHGFDHIMRVYDVAMQIAQKENANKDIVALAVLLHDADDYKLFGQDNADNLTNTKNILNKYNVCQEVQENVIDIVRNMGYSKSLQGIRPQSLEGKIVSDADMIDAIGALGLVRCLSYSLHKENNLFDENVFPEINLTTEEYKQKNRKSDNFVNHFFEKLLKIQGLLFTQAAFDVSVERQDFMITFLNQYFKELNLKNWQEYLSEYINNSKKVA